MVFHAFVARHAGAVCVAAALILAAIGFYLAVSPQSIPRLFPNQDKLEHFLAFGVLAGLVSFNAKALMSCAMSVAALTVVVEIGQAVLSTTREASWDDVFAGVLGVAFVVAAVRIWREAQKMALAPQWGALRA